MADCLSCNRTLAGRSKKRFCSRSCSATVNNRLHPKRQRTAFFNCPACHKERRRKGACLGCSSRKRTSDERTLSDFIFESNKRHPSWRWSRLRTLARDRYRSERRGGCEVCGYNKHVEVAHIRALSTFPLTATIGEVNARSNVRFLCPNHHWEFDNGRR